MDRSSVTRTKPKNTQPNGSMVSRLR